jgi:ribosome-associated heat shock protein Hsp15
VKSGDVLTVALDRNVRVLKVVAFAERRGGAEAGKTLYADLSPPPVRPPERLAPRERGAGRPTKRERRAIDHLREPDEF